MSKLVLIADFLKTLRPTYLSSYRYDEGSNTLVLEIPVTNLGSKAGKGVTSKRQLAYLRRQLEERYELRVVTILRESQQLLDIESGLRALLQRRFVGQVSDVYMSFPPGRGVQVWISVTGEQVVPIRPLVEDQTREFLESACLLVEEIAFLETGRVEPPVASVLRAIKLLSPAKCEAVMEYLVGKGFSISTEQWLRAKLDGVRKKGLVIRNSDGSYVLSASGISLVPHSRSRSSSDVERILLLARFKRW